MGGGDTIAYGKDVSNSKRKVTANKNVGNLPTLESSCDMVRAVLGVNVITHA